MERFIFILLLYSGKTMNPLLFTLAENKKSVD